MSTATISGVGSTFFQGTEQPASDVSGVASPHTVASIQPMLKTVFPVADRDDPRTPDHSIRKFACPFYRLDPIAHEDCLRFTLNRMQDVMQHLRRKHKTETDLKVDFSANAKERRHLAADKRWLSIWMELFPSSEPPPNIHLGSHLEEAATLLAHYWKHCPRDLLEDSKNLDGPACLKGDSSGRLHGVILDIIRAAASRMVSAKLDDPDTGTSNTNYWMSPELMDEMSAPLGEEGLKLATGDQEAYICETSPFLSSCSENYPHFSLDDEPSSFLCDDVDLQAMGAAEVPQLSGLHGVFTPRAGQNHEPHFGPSLDVSDVSMLG